MEPELHLVLGRLPLGDPPPRGVVREGLFVGDLPPALLRVLDLDLELSLALQQDLQT